MAKYGKLPRFEKNEKKIFNNNHSKIQPEPHIWKKIIKP